MDFGPYTYCQHPVTDAADALTFLNDWWAKGYEYVEGLPRFGVGGNPSRDDADSIVSVLLKKVRR